MGKKLFWGGAVLVALPFLIRFAEMVHARVIGPRPSSLMDASVFGVSVLVILCASGAILLGVGGILYLLKV